MYTSLYARSRCTRRVHARLDTSGHRLLCVHEWRSVLAGLSRRVGYSDQTALRSPLLTVLALSAFYEGQDGLFLLVPPLEPGRHPKVKRRL